MCESPQTKPPSTVDGVRLDGSDITIVRNIPITPQNGQENHGVPVMLRSGIPLYARKESIRTTKTTNFAICRIMSDPDIGLSQGLWQDFTGAPAPTLLFRTDGIPYTRADHDLLDEFEMTMLDDGPRRVTPQDWIKFAWLRRENVPHKLPPRCYFLDEGYTKPVIAPLISDDSVRTLFLGGDSKLLSVPKVGKEGCVHGIRLHGEKVEAAEVPFRGESVDVGVARLVGIPLKARLLRKERRESRSMFRMTRLMKHPLTGRLPKNWEEPCMMRGYWPIHMFRSDGIPFTIFDYFILEQFCTWLEGKHDVSAEVWGKWIAEYVQRHVDEGVCIGKSMLLTQGLFGKGRRVRVDGLVSRSELNGVIGVVAKEGCRSIGRIGVQLPDVKEPLAVKVENLVALDE